MAPRKKKTAATRAQLNTFIQIASRSPSAHNTQPWAPRIEGDTISVAVIPGRTLPAGDPGFRDVILALGAWAEGVAIAAAAQGFAMTLTPLPALHELDSLPITGPADPEKPVFSLTFVEAEVQSPFSVSDVRARRVYRGALRGEDSTFADVTAAQLPEWLTLKRLDNAAMTALVPLGIAYTASRPSVAKELLHWLRLDLTHPQYFRDGMNDAMLQLSRRQASLASPFTASPPLQKAALAVAGVVGQFLESAGRNAPLPPASSYRDGEPTHHVLVANARIAGHDGVHSATEAMDSVIGLGLEHTLEAGRALHRLWLLGHQSKIVVSPHSEVIDAPSAHGLLRKRLGLGRSDVALAVFSAGRTSQIVPRSPRLTDPRLRR